MHPRYRLPQSGKTTGAGLWLGAMGILFCSLVMSLFVMAEYVAWQLGFQSALGKPFVSFWRVKIYDPIQLAFWWWRYSDLPNTAHIWTTASHLFHGLMALSLVVVLFCTVRRGKRMGGKTDLHGSARWAEKKDVQEFLSHTHGVTFGGWQDGRATSYLRHNQPWNVFVSAPPRSGKSTGIVIPTLFSWPHSAIVFDIRGELWDLTAGYRTQQGQRCLRWDPTDTTGTAVCHNPLFEIRPYPHDVEDAQLLVEYVMNPDGKADPDHWDRTTYTLLVAGILHQLYVGKDKSLAGVVGLYADAQQEVNTTLQDMLVAAHDPQGRYGWTDNVTGQPTKTHPYIASAVRESLDRPAKERGSIISTTLGYLRLYRDPILTANTSVSDLRIEEIVTSKQPVSLYLTVQPNQLDRLRPLLRLFLAQCLGTLATNTPTGMKRHPLLLVADEFPVLGKHKVFSEQMAYLAGFGITSLLITQDPHQVNAVYGPENTIASMCDIRVAFAPNAVRTAQEYSHALGSFTALKESRTFTGSRFSPMLNHTIAGEQESARALLTPDEIMRLGKDEMLIFVNGRPPILGRKTPYYRDPTLATWAKIPAPRTTHRTPVSHPWTYVQP